MPPSAGEDGAGANEKQEIVLHCPMLPCWDESDDGVPPFCRGEIKEVSCNTWWKVFNREHPLTNDNLFMYMFGNTGYPYFDRHRKCWMAVAMWSTFVSIFFTIAGCCALSEDLAVVKMVRWAW